MRHLVKQEIKALDRQRRGRGRGRRIKKMMAH
jgi:hypothetical protein